MRKKRPPRCPPRCLVYIWGLYYTVIWGYKINHFNRDPFFKQPVFYGKFFDVFFFVAQKNIREFGKFQEDDNMGRWMKLGLFSWDFFVVSPHPKRSHPEAHVIFRASQVPLGYGNTKFFPDMAGGSPENASCFQRKIPQEAAGSCRRNGRSSMLPHNCCPETLERCLISWEQISKSF